MASAEEVAVGKLQSVSPKDLKRWRDAKDVADIKDSLFIEVYADLLTEKIGGDTGKIWKLLHEARESDANTSENLPQIRSILDNENARLIVTEWQDKLHNPACNRDDVDEIYKALNTSLKSNHSEVKSILQGIIKKTLSTSNLSARSKMRCSLL